MAKYYFCEANNADQGVTNVTPFEDAESALQAAEDSTAEVHFISTIDPLAEDEEEETA